MFTIVSENKGFALYQNAKILRTPKERPLIVPTQSLALAIVEEFERQGAKKDVRKMPLTQMAITAIDVTSENRQAAIAGIMDYGAHELLCQCAQSPVDLVDRQAGIWQPYLDWCKATFGAELKTGVGIIPFKQNKEALDCLRTCVESLDPFYLTGLGEACHSTGSLILGLALMNGRADVHSVFEAAELDSLWQAEKWGKDESLESRHAQIRQELGACMKWFLLLKE